MANKIIGCTKIQEFLYATVQKTFKGSLFGATPPKRHIIYILDHIPYTTNTVHILYLTSNKKTVPLKKLHCAPCKIQGQNVLDLS